MELTPRVQNALLGVLAVVAISLSVFAAWSVSRPPTAALSAATSTPGSGAAPASGAGGDPAADSAAPDGAADGSAATAAPAVSSSPATVEDWVAAWSGPGSGVLVIGDGFSNLRSQWIHQWAILLAAERPVQIEHWAEAEDVSFNEPDILSDGAGSELTVWNASRADTTIAEAAEHLQTFRAAAGEVDAVLVSLGRGSADEDVAASLDELVGALEADLPVLLVIAPPGLTSTSTSDAILAWAQAHEDRVSVVDLRESAPEVASAEQWAAAFASALALP